MVKADWALEGQLNEIASEVRRFEKGRAMLVNFFKKIKEYDFFDNKIRSAFSDIIESKLSYPVLPVDLTGLKVTGVDGGMLSRSLQILDIVLVRAVAVVFKYEVGGKVKAYYYPKEYPPPKVVFNLNPLSQADFEVSASLERLSSELEVAIKVQREYDIDLLLLDGSLIPQVADKPLNPSLESKYLRVVGLFEKLYKTCSENDVALAGIIKDSRSTRFVQTVSKVTPLVAQRNNIVKEVLSFDYRFFIQKMLDLDFLFRLLDKGERSTILKYSENPELHPTLKDISGDWRDKIYVTYVKPAEFDMPLRVEFLALGDPITSARKITSAVMSLSSHHPEYALPSVQLEAHAQVKLAEKEMNFICDQLIHKIGLPPHLFKLRNKSFPPF